MTTGAKNGVEIHENLPRSLQIGTKNMSNWRTVIVLTIGKCELGRRHEIVVRSGPDRVIIRTGLNTLQIVSVSPDEHRKSSGRSGSTHFTVSFDEH